MNRLENKKFGRLVAIKYLGKSLWQCNCVCGNIVNVNSSKLVSGHTKSCGCLRKEVNYDRLHIDLNGKIFGRLTVISYSHKYKTSSYWNCKCICGNYKLVDGGALRSGSVVSCGCYRLEQLHNKLFNDLTGKKFGRLTVISLLCKDEVYFWNCLCDCGNKAVVSTNSLVSKNTKSCGCLAMDSRTKHNLHNSKIYRCYNNMIKRCYLKSSHDFHNYGGRGISVCERWRDNFVNFKNDMYESYQNHVEEFGEKETTIERINVNGNYCKENCTWATNIEQANNKRNSNKTISR